MRAKFIELDPTNFKKTIGKYMKYGYHADETFYSKQDADNHINKLYNEGKDIVVFTESKTIRWYVYVKNPSRMEVGM